MTKPTNHQSDIRLTYTLPANTQTADGKFIRINPPPMTKPTEQQMEDLFGALAEMSSREGLSINGTIIRTAIETLSTLRDQVATLTAEREALKRHLAEARLDEVELLDSRERALAESARLREEVARAVSKSEATLRRHLTVCREHDESRNVVTCRIDTELSDLLALLRTHIDDRTGE
jgi:DNA-binding transcriptional ArsR family regulator